MRNKYEAQPSFTFKDDENELGGDLNMGLSITPEYLQRSKDFAEQVKARRPLITTGRHDVKDKSLEFSKNDVVTLEPITKERISYLYKLALLARANKDTHLEPPVAGNIRIGISDTKSIEIGYWDQPSKDNPNPVYFRLSEDSDKYQQILSIIKSIKEEYKGEMNLINSPEIYKTDSTSTRDRDDDEEETLWWKKY